MTEQEASQLQQQLQLIEQNINEMQDINESLVGIEKGSNDILANLGKNIYIPVEIKDKKLIIEVGNKNYVKKSIPEAKEVIEDQIKKLMKTKMEILGKLQELQSEMENMMQELQKTQEKESKEQKKK